MKQIKAFVITLISSAMSYQTVYADGETPVAPQSTVIENVTSDGFPWGLVVVFIIAGFIITYFKRNNPDRLSSTSCVPLPDEEQKAREDARFTEDKT